MELGQHMQIVKERHANASLLVNSRLALVLLVVVPLEVLPLL